MKKLYLSAYLLSPQVSKLLRFFKKNIFLLFLFITIKVSAQSIIFSSFTPLSGPVGTIVKITGRGFSQIASENTVYFGAAKATVLAATSISLTVTVPEGSTCYPITVTAKNLTAYSSVPFITTFPCGGISGTSFLTKKDFSVSGFTYGNTLKDMDGDGKTDVLVIGGSTLSVFRNTSSAAGISFVNAFNSVASGYLITVASDDLDGDGRPDVVITNFSGNALSIFQNTSTAGNISLSYKTDYTTGINPYGMVIGDIDMDGKPDIIVANQYSSPGTISIFRNTSTNGIISFDAKTDIIAGTQPRSIAIADIDLDGEPDIAITNEAEKSVSVLRNISAPGFISFEGKKDFLMPSSSNPESIAIGDLDGDKKPDLAIANNNNPGTISVLINTGIAGTISFAPRVEFETGLNPFSILIGDMSGEGKLDIAVTNQNENSVSILENTSQPGVVAFVPKRDFVTGPGPRSISLSDFDGDQKPDLIVGNNGTNSFSVLKNAATLPIPEIFIASSLTSICVGTSVTFTANETGAGTSPIFKWKVNDISAGTNSSSYTTSMLNNNDSITCELTANDASCGVAASAVSKSIKMTVNPLPVVSISGDTCVGSVLTVTSNIPPDSLIWTLKNTGIVSTQTAKIQPDAITVAGGNGSGTNANQLSKPDRFFIDATGNMYIPDMSNNRIQKWAPGATTGVTVAGGNGAGNADNQFDRPTSVALDSKGNLYITDQNNDRVQKWAPGALSGVNIGPYFSTPTAIFIDAQDNIYVSEQNNASVTKVPAGSTTGSIVAGGNGYGSGANQLSSPTGIFVDATGNLYVCDIDNNRIQKWAPGATSGVTVAGGNNFGSGSDQLANPIGIFVDSYGNIYISDFNNGRIQEWAPGATSGITIAGGNGSGAAANQLYLPAGIWVNENGDVIVSDFYNSRVQKFLNTVTKTYTAITPGDYTATAISGNGCKGTSDAITIVASKTAEVIIKSNTTAACSGVPVTFTASAVFGGSVPLFQWKVNGINTQMNSSKDTFTSNTLQAGDVVSCEMTSNASFCLTSKKATSNSIVMTTASPETASVIITATDTIVCAGLAIQFIAAPQNGGTNPTYQWKINGADAAATSNNPVFSSTSLKNGDLVSCIITSSANLCPASLTSASNTITIHIVATVISSVTIAASDTLICNGSTVNFTSTSANSGSMPVYTWKVNGINTGNNNSIFSGNTFKNGDIVSCAISSSLQCALPVESNNITMSVDQIPVITIRADTVIFLGSSIRLHTIASGNIDTYHWSPSASLDNFTVASPLATPTDATTTYQLLVTTRGGCKASGQVTISTITEVIIPNVFSPNNDGINDVWNIPGLSSYADCKVEVYNRYGSLLFRSAGYNSPWNGTYNGQPVPVGTYYYIISIPHLNSKKAGSITVLR